MKFHITAGGAKPCSATKRACPVGGQHFSTLEEAQKSFEIAQPTTLAGKGKNKSLPKVQITTSVKPFAGGHYFGCHVNADTLQQHLEAWRSEVGQEQAEIMASAKAARDRGTIYHMTVITPPELKQIKGKLSNFPAQVTFTYEGVGKAEDKGNEAWYVVCSSPELQTWRKSNNLAPKDFHITLGFTPKDVHTKPKGLETLIVR